MLFLPTHALPTLKSQPPVHQVHFLPLTARRPLIMVPVTINGQGPFQCIVDTGNGSFPLLVGHRTAEQLKLDSSSFKKKQGYAVDIDASGLVGSVDSFDIAGIHVSRPTIAISPSVDQLASRLGNEPLDGNVGYPFFKDYTLTFDFVNSILSFSAGPTTGDSVPFKIEKSKPLILVEVTVNGKPLHFVLDTGAGMVCISTEAAAKLGLKKLHEVSLNKGDKEKGYISLIDTLEAGTKIQRNVSVVAAGFLEDLSKELKTPIDGILGYNFWSQYKLIVDYPRKRIVFADPNPPTKL